MNTIILWRTPISSKPHSSRVENPRRENSTLRGSLAALYAALLAISQAGCATNWQSVALGAGIATASGAYSPNNEIQQIYYLGVFDPQEQTPPSVYRVRVHGQASFISRTKFGSGWVPARLIDSLGSEVKFDRETGSITMTPAEDDAVSALTTGRRQIMFGPEGFREAPKDHRLVIVMGSSPDKFFEAIDEALGSISDAEETARNTRLTGELLEALTNTRGEKAALNQLNKDIAADLPKPTEGE